MGFVRRIGPVAVEGGPEAPVVAADAVLEELRAIRRLLEGAGGKVGAREAHNTTRATDYPPSHQTCKMR